MAVDFLSEKTGMLSVLLAILLVYVVWSTVTLRRTPPALRTAAVLVLGDVGRSPRMMYHAESFAKTGFMTYVVGYKGAKPISSLLVEPRLRLCYLSQPPKSLARLPFIVTAPIKVAHQLFSLFHTFLVKLSPAPEFIIVQNPPSIPTLAVVWVVSLIRGSKVIIDWHNLGYTILTLKLGPRHLLVRIAQWFERTFGRSAYAHLFVTQAMHDRLVEEWGLTGHKAVLHDRPPSHFHRTTPQETHELFLRLAPSLTTQSSLGTFLPSFSTPYSTPFTQVPSSAELAAAAAPSANDPAPPPLPYSDASRTIGGGAGPAPLAGPERRPDRPALLVSSTSWTPDEDFGVLLRALATYEARAREVNEQRDSAGRKALPKVLCIVTGRGPLRDKYMNDVARLQSGDDGWRWVRCVSLWLEVEDYPLLLGAANLGVCLHASSSALDLPMKVVDMYGCGLPVCALEFACLDELVKDGINGLVFKDDAQLAAQLESLLADFTNRSGPLAALEASLVRSSSPPPGSPPRPYSPRGEEPSHWEWCTWTENWDNVVKRLVLRDAERFEQ